MNPKSFNSFAYGLRASAGALALSAAVFVPAVAHAQDAPAADSHTGEIVVTARSKGETLLEVPVAVTAFGADQLAKSAASDLTKIAQMAPQLEIYAGGAGSGGSFLIRGVGTTADTAGVDMSVSLAVDGTQIARPRTAYAGMFDLAQVAVMKGPQALFFGRNATAGVVSIESANPTADLSGYVRGGYEFKARERYVEGAISIPVTDTLGVRFAGRYSKLRGWVENKAQGIAVDPFNSFENVALPGAAWKWGPGSESKGGRITIKWDPSSVYSSIMKATFLGYNDVSATSTGEPVCDGNPTVFGVWDGVSDCKLNGVVRQGQLPGRYAEGPLGDRKWFSGVPYSKMSAMLLTWQQTLNLENFTITSNTGYSKHKFGLRGNYSGMEFVDFHGGVDEDYKGFSQEVRVITDFDGPFNFTFGGYYEHTKNYHDSALYLFNAGPDPITGSYQAGYNEAYEKNTIWSGFAQARFDVTPELELAAGARYTKTKKSAIQGQPRYVNQAFDPNFTPPSATGGFLLPQGTVLDSRLSEDNWSPEASITWHPSPDQTVYAAIKTGYKSGGIAMPSLVTIASTDESVIFKPEKAKGGEIGYKARMFNRAVTFEATAYYYKFTGLQLTSFDPPTSSYKIQNAANAEQYGLEVNATYRMDNGLTLRAAGAYNHLNYQKFIDAPCWTNQTALQGCVFNPAVGADVQDLSNTKLHRAPRFSGSVGADYDTSLGGSLMLGLSADVRYTTSYFASETLGPASKQHDYALVNASMRVYKDDDSWELALIGRNLTNQRVIGFYQDKTGAITSGVNEGYAYGSRPREVAVQATLRF